MLTCCPCGRALPSCLATLPGGASLKGSCMKGFLHHGLGESDSGLRGSVAVAAREPMNRPPNRRALKANLGMAPGFGRGRNCRAAVACDNTALPPICPACRDNFSEHPLNLSCGWICKACSHHHVSYISPILSQRFFVEETCIFASLTYRLKFSSLAGRGHVDRN